MSEWDGFIGAEQGVESSAVAESSEWDGFIGAEEAVSSEWDGFVGADVEQSYDLNEDLGLSVVEGSKELGQALHEAPKSVAGGAMRMIGDQMELSGQRARLHEAQGGRMENALDGEFVQPISKEEMMDRPDHVPEKWEKPIEEQGRTVALAGKLLVDEQSERRADRAEKRAEENPRYFGGRFADNPSLARAAAGAAPSVPGMMVAMVNPALGASMLAAQESIPAYSEMRDAGFETHEALGLTALHGAGSMVLEKMPFDLSASFRGSGLAQALGPKVAAGIAVVMQAGSEAGTEVLQEGWQYATERGYEGSLEEFVEEVDLLDVAASAALTGGTVGSAQSLLNSFAERSAVSPEESAPVDPVEVAEPVAQDAPVVESVSEEVALEEPVQEPVQESVQDPVQEAVESPAEESWEDVEESSESTEDEVDVGPLAAGMPLPTDPEQDDIRDPLQRVDRIQPVELDAKEYTREEAREIYKQLMSEDLADGRPLSFVRGIFGKLAGHKGRELIFRMVPRMKEIASRAEYAWSEPEVNAPKGTSIKAFHHYVSKVKADGSDYYVRITVQEVVDERNQLHSVFISDMEVMDAHRKTPISDSSETAGGKPVGFDKRLAEWLYNVNKTGGDPESDGEIIAGAPVVVEATSSKGRGRSFPVEPEQAVAMDEKLPTTKQAAEIVKYIEDAFGVKVRGKMTYPRTSSLGHYELSRNLVRLNDIRDIDTALHELGHRIDRMMNTPTRRNGAGLPKEVSAELAKMGRDLYGEKKPAVSYQSEGLAEYLAYRLMGEDPEGRAPATHKWFNEWLQENPKQAKAIRRLEKKVNEYRVQGAPGRVRAFSEDFKMDWSPESTVSRIKSWVGTAYDKLVDDTDGLRRAVKETGLDPAEISAEDNPYLLATAFAMGGAGKAREALFEQTVDVYGRKTGEGLLDALAPLGRDASPESQKKFWDYMVARRALQINRTGRESGLSDADAQYVVDLYQSPEFQEAARRVTAV